VLSRRVAVVLADRMPLADMSRRYRLLRLSYDLKRPYDVSQLLAQRASRTDLYFHCVYGFDHFLPKTVREHRAYFCDDDRGFGEDAFHYMWYLLFREFRPTAALEIGVYRGQTITLWKLLSRTFGYECHVGCVSPFDASNDTVSTYSEKIDYYTDTVTNHKHFALPLPEFCRSRSTDPEAFAFINARRWDLIYIDGSHDYEVVRSDMRASMAAIRPGGLIVLDDSALFTDYRPPIFATAGHPGPSRSADEVDGSRLVELLGVGHNRVFQDWRAIADDEGTEGAALEADDMNLRSSGSA
jgi:hypothetical protein